MKKRSMCNFIWLVLCLFLLSGCAKANNTIAETGKLTEASIQDLPSWKIENVILDKQYDNVCVTNDFIYGGYNSNAGTVITCLEKATGKVKWDTTLSDIEYLYNINADEQGIVYLLGNNGTEDAFYKMSSENSLEELNFVLENSESAFYTLPKGIYADNAGHLYVHCEMCIPLTEIEENGEKDVYGTVERIYVKDTQSQESYYVQIPTIRGNSVLSFDINEEGTPFLLAKKDEQMYLQYIDLEQKELGKTVNLEGNGAGISESGVVPVSDGVIYCESNKMYKYEYASQTGSLWVDLAACGISVDDIIYMGMRNGTIEIVDNYRDDTEYLVLSEGESEKRVVSIGTVFVSQDLEEAVTYFNRYNKDIQVKIVSYWNEESSYEDNVNRLKMDIISGNAPDIIEVSDAYMSTLVQKGVFVDLYAFMETDTECKKDSLINNICEIYEKDGHLYSIAPAFKLYSMWGSPEVVQGRSGISQDELKSILQENGKNINAVSGLGGDETALAILCTFAMDGLIDWEKGSCDFTGEYFQDILMLAKEYETEKKLHSDDRDSIIKKVNNGDVLISGGMIADVGDYQIQKELFGGEIDVLGYPTTFGSGTAAGFLGSQVAINAESEHADEAWQFVKSYILHGYAEMGFPIVDSLFEEVLQMAMEPEYFILDDGITKVEIGKDSLHTEDGEIIVYAASTEDVEAIRQMVENTTQKMQRYAEIQNIIDEEAQAYFLEQKSLEETATIIQSRVTLYLEEQMD